MKESILDVLLYLFEHYFANDAVVSGDDLTAQDGPLTNVSLCQALSARWASVGGGVLDVTSNLAPRCWITT